MNRTQRRQQQQQLKREGVVTLHQRPEDIGPELTALLLAQLASAFTVATGMGMSLPVHVTVEVGGRRACGSIDRGEKSVVVDPEHTAAVEST